MTKIIECVNCGEKMNMPNNFKSELCARCYEIKEIYEELKDDWWTSDR